MCKSWWMKFSKSILPSVTYPTGGVAPPFSCSSTVFLSFSNSLIILSIWPIIRFTFTVNLLLALDSSTTSSCPVLNSSFISSKSWKILKQKRAFRMSYIWYYSSTEKHFKTEVLCKPIAELLLSSHLWTVETVKYRGTRVKINLQNIPKCCYFVTSISLTNSSQFSLLFIHP